MGADWRGSTSNLSDLVSNLHREPASIRDSFTDVTIILPDNTEIKAHKFVLAVASPRFEAMFFGVFADNGDTFTVKDIESQTFKNLIDYIYNSGNETNLETSDYWSLLEAAHLYVHKGLIQHCNTKLSRHIRNFEVSEELVNFINRSVEFSIYDNLVDVATKVVIDIFTEYFKAGLLDKLNQTSLQIINAKLNDSTWIEDANTYLSIQLRLRYLDWWDSQFSDDMRNVFDHCKDKLSKFMRCIKSQQDFIQMIEENLFCDDSDELEEEVMERVKDHLQEQNWEMLRIRTYSS